MPVCEQRQLYRSSASSVATNPQRFWLIVGCCALVGTCLWFRVWRLDSIAGINADEAWYGVQAESLLHGEPISWLTPTGNPLNPFFMGLTIALHAAAEPSIVLLRTPAVLCGLLALVCNFWFCRGLFGVKTAITSTVVMAVLPLDIVYSRIAWDASQSLLASLATMYVSLWSIVVPWPQRRWWQIASVLMLAAAVLVHPTNIFIAPFVCVPMMYGNRIAGQSDCAQQSGAARPARRLSLGLIVFAILGLFLLATQLFWPRLGMAASRIIDPSEYRAFVVNFVGLFSGSTVLEYVSGAIAPRYGSGFDIHRMIYDLPIGIALAICGWGVYQRILSREARLDRCLALAWGATVIGFFVVAGPQALEPHWERYGICLVAPTILLAVRGALWWPEQLQRKKIVMAWLVVVLGWIWVTGFYVDYFLLFSRTGGESHPAFRTATVEPKVEALRYILSQRVAEQPTYIVASDWWSFWPLRYLAAGRPDVFVVQTAADVRHLRAPHDSTLKADAQSGTVWEIKFVENPWFFSHRETMTDANRISEEMTIVPDAAGKPLIEIYRQIPREL